ncbi:MAG: hypothetical protein WCF85_08500 [Rhodospirillaceae bacterium]
MPWIHHSTLDVSPGPPIIWYGHGHGLENDHGKAAPVRLWFEVIRWESADAVGRKVRNLGQMGHGHSGAGAAGARGHHGRS